MNFELERNGYNRGQVDSYIKKLNIQYERQLCEQKDRIYELVNQNDSLMEKFDTLSSKESSISRALLVAVDKAKQIEDGSRRIYQLEIQRLRLLFNRYRDFLDDLIENNSDSTSIQSTRKLIDEFKRQITDTLAKNFNVPVHDVSAYDPMRALLDKMNNHIANRYSDSESRKKSREEEEVINAVKHKSIIKPIANVLLTNTDKYENIVDKFLEEEEAERTKLLKKLIPAESEGDSFDIKKAINPTESLEEIMKAFDFFEEGEDL